MAARVPSARALAVARLSGHAPAFRKHGTDGSAKLDLRRARGETVWGVVYRLRGDEQHRLDTAEGPGYRVVEVTVTTDDGPLDAFTYVARACWHTQARPRAWYRDLVVAGAREHRLPADYVSALAAVTAIEDAGAAHENSGAAGGTASGRRP